MIESEGHLSLLLVHRDDAVLRRLDEAARQSGFFAPPVTMTDGRFALEHVWQCLRGENRDATAPDAIVAGLQLGGLNGIQLTRELRRYEETRGVFVALLPATASARDQDAAETAGGDFFLRRPDSAAGLAKAFAAIAHRCVAKASPLWFHAARLWHASFSGSGLDVSDAELRPGSGWRGPKLPTIIELGQQPQPQKRER